MTYDATKTAKTSDAAIPEQMKQTRLPPHANFEYFAFSF